MYIEPLLPNGRVRARAIAIRHFRGYPLPLLHLTSSRNNPPGGGPLLDPLSLLAHCRIYRLMMRVSPTIDAARARPARRRLGIEYLRSPAMAHPDHFDVHSLLAYAVSNRRDERELIDSGCSSLRQLAGLGHQTHVGLWKLPSADLFRDFCQEDVVRRLDHDYVRGTAIDLNRIGVGARAVVVGADYDDDTGGHYAVTLSDGTVVESTSVILALGPTGAPVIPSGIRDVPPERLVSWRDMNEKLRDDQTIVLVVGGGLTAVQAAQHCLRRGKSVILSSRRPLVERHFDIRECWFDKRRANRHVSDFYHQDVDRRLDSLREARGGGSVPPLYMDDLREWARRGKLTLVDNADPVYVRTDDDGRLWMSMKGDREVEGTDDGGRSRSKSSIAAVDCVVLACGIRPDCTANPFVRRILDRFPINIVGGLPDVSVDLEWTNGLFVVGALASLNVGPDGGNIMGARRAATIVSNALECKSWLRREGVGALSNPFHMLSDDGDSSSDDDDDGD